MNIKTWADKVELVPLGRDSETGASRYFLKEARDLVEGLRHKGPPVFIGEVKGRNGWEIGTCIFMLLRTGPNHYALGMVDPIDIKQGQMDIPRRPPRAFMAQPSVRGDKEQIIKDTAHLMEYAIIPHEMYRGLDSGLAGMLDGRRHEWTPPPGGIPDREDKELSNRLIVLYRIWLHLHDAAGGRLKAGMLPSGVKNVPSHWTAFREAADVLQYHIQDYPNVSTKKQILADMFSGSR